VQQLARIYAVTAYTYCIQLLTAVCHCCLHLGPNHHTPYIVYPLDPNHQAPQLRAAFIYPRRASDVRLPHSSLL
jgi:hypothetical protein